MFNRAKIAIKNPKRALNKLVYKISKPFGNKKYKQFIIFCRKRVGSNMLVSLLNGHERIKCYREVAKRRSKFESAKKLYGVEPKFIKAVGLKMIYHHPVDDDENKTWKEILRFEDVVILHLIRKNILRSVISRIVALEEGEWVSNEEGGLKRVKVDPDYVIGQIDKTKRKIQQVENFFDKKIARVYYKSLVRQRNKEMKKVFGRIGVSTKGVKTLTKRQNPYGLNKIVKNFSQLKEAFKGTKYEWMIEE